MGKLAGVHSAQALSLSKGYSMTNSLPILSETQITRDSLGKFIKGVSGNPKGRSVGSKNRVVLMKQAMEEALTRDLAEDFKAILAEAITQAKDGDKDMIKFLLGDVLKEVRRADGGEGDDGGPKRIEVSISQYFGPEATRSAAEAIDAEFKTISTNTGLSKPT